MKNLPVKILGPDGQPYRREGNSASVPPGESFKRARFEGAESNRLNSAHWANISGQNINRDIAADLDTLRDRSNYELANNSMVAGVVNTYVCDVVGRDGPSLQVITSNRAYAKKLEALFWRWWEEPDINGVLSGPDMLQLWVRSLWPNGEYFYQFAPVDDVIDFRLNTIAPSRVDNPAGRSGDRYTTLGIQRTPTGKPLQYFVSQPDHDEFAFPNPAEYVALPAHSVGHSFLMLEPGQARGIPWLAQALSVVADIRDYNVQVMDAARQAADYAIILSRTDETDTYANVNEAVEIERRMITNAPPGWTPHQLKPEQPTTGYSAFIHERYRELGRTVNMPLMMVLLDSSGSNYSSARFDGQIYMRGIQQLEAQIERRDLNRILRRIMDRAELAGALPRRPTDVRFVWTWPTLPSVDPVKDAQAAEIRLRIGTSTLINELAATGTDIEDHVAAVRRVLDAYSDAGLAVPGGGQETPAAPAGMELPEPTPLTSDEEAAAEAAAEEQAARRLVARRNGHTRNGHLNGAVN